MWTIKTPFAPPDSKSQLEEGADLTPKFDANGLISAIVTDVISGEVLMLAHMNAEALALSLKTGDAWYFSRSRSKLWRKGETSGNTQKIVEIRVDCDQDAIWIKVQQTGPACHTDRKSCFYREVALETKGPKLISK
jgi:phosphoribosyl-AMP cyclohydrolase